MVKPLVTIAIPIFNAERHLRYSIQSVLNQTYKSFELILLNDGSTDSSMDIARSFNDKRIKIIDDGVNRGLIYRLNQSTKISEGKYYARMDADDIMYITRIEEQVDFMEKHPEIDLIGSSIMTIDDKNNIVGSGFSKGKVSGFVHPTVMGKTSWFWNNPYASWAERAEDTELWLRTYNISHFWSLEKPLLFYREYGVSSVSKYIKSQKTLLKICSNYKEYGKTLSWYLKHTIISYVKILAYVVFACLHQTDYLVAKRSRIPIPKSDCLTKQDLIKSIDEQ